LKFQVDIEKINNEILDFQNKCRKLPKALKDYDAFNDLKRKIDDFNETCPLLEMMANKAMKERHWERIEGVRERAHAL
jgi:dynein heavy chain